MSPRRVGAPCSRRFDERFIKCDLRSLEQRAKEGEVRLEPRAMRERREPFRIFGFRRSPGVIDRMIASVRSISLSSKFSSCCFIWPMPGSIPSIFFIEPIFFIC